LRLRLPVIDAPVVSNDQAATKIFREKQELFGGGSEILRRLEVIRLRQVNIWTRHAKRWISICAINQNLVFFPHLVAAGNYQDSKKGRVSALAALYAIGLMDPNISHHPRISN